MNSRRQKARHWRYRAEYFGVMILGVISRFLPRSWILAMGAFLGEAAYFLVSRRRRITLDNLRQAFRAADINYRKTAHRAYRSLGQNVMEFLGTADFDRSAILRMVRVEGQQHVEEAIRQNKGVIFLGSHYGNWELMNLAHSAMGYPTHVVGRALDNPWLDRMVNRQRERFGSTVINSKSPSSLREILSALRHKKSVGFLIDQSVVGDRGVYVDFFGRLAYTHRAVVLVALKTGAPVIPMFMHREEKGDHRLSYEKALPLIKTGHLEGDVLVNTQMMTRAIEDVIRRSPEQWLWMHERWKKQPPAECGAVFLDRDGTINREAGYIRDPDQLQLLPDSAKAIRMLNGHGIKVIVVTNQSGVARGFYPEEHVHRVHNRLMALLQTEGAVVEAIYYCPHHPTEGNGAYTRVCECRKPKPGMLYRAASDRGIDLRHSFVVGDKLTDIEMARRVGAKGILILAGDGLMRIEQTDEVGLQPDAIVPDLEKAAQWILIQIERASRSPQLAQRFSGT